MDGTNTALLLYSLLLMASSCTGSILPTCDCSQALAAIQARMEELEVSLSNQANKVQNHEGEIVSLTQNAESNQMNTNNLNQMYLLLTTKVLTMENKLSSMEQRLSAASDNKNVNDIQNATSLNIHGLLALEGKVQRHDQAISEHWKEIQNIKQTIEDHSLVITQQNQSIESHQVMLEDLNDTMEEHERSFRCCEELANCSRDVSSHTTEPTNAVSTIGESTSAVPTTDVSTHKTPEPTNAVLTIGLPTMMPRPHLTIASPNGSRYGPVAALPGGEALVADLNKVVRLDRRGRVVPPAFTCRNSIIITGLVLDGDQLYIVHYDGLISRVRVSSLNITQAEWWVPGVGYVYPGAVAGNELYLVDYNIGTAFSFNLVNQRKVVRTTGLSHPASITTTTLHSPTRRLFIISEHRGHIKVYSQSWSLTATIGQDQLEEPFQVLVTPWSTILVAEWDNHRVSEFSLSGGFIRHLLTSRDGLYQPGYITYSRPYLWVVHETRGGDPHTVRRYHIVQ